MLFFMYLDYICLLVLILLTISFVSFSANTIYSLLLLILIYCVGFILLLCWNIEYFAFLILIIYAGAITILFLFTVMMLNLKFKTIKFNLEISSIIFISISIFIYFLINWYNSHGWSCINNYNLDVFHTSYVNKLSLIDTNTLLQSLSNLIYTDYYLVLLLVGFILLIGFIGAILITFESNSIKKLNLNKILSRTSFLKKQLK